MRGKKAMSKKRGNKEKRSNDSFILKCSAGGGALGTTVGVVKGGGIGVAAFGTAIGLPLWVPLAVCGAVAGGSIGAGYYLYKKASKKKK